VFHFDHVIDRNAFGDANDQIETGIYALEDRVRCKRRRNKNSRNGGSRFPDRLIHRIKDRHIIGKELTAFAGRYTGGNVRSVVKAKLRVPRAEAASDALHENAGLWGDKNGHGQKNDLRGWRVRGLPCGSPTIASQQNGLSAVSKQTGALPAFALDASRRVPAPLTIFKRLS
jgi:hypothetical protein